MPDWWTPAREQALAITALEMQGMCPRGEPGCKDPLHFRVIDPKYRPVWIPRETPYARDVRASGRPGRAVPEEHMIPCRITTHTAIGPGTGKPGYIPMTVHTDLCVFLQPGVERTRLTKELETASQAKIEQMISDWKEEDKQRRGEGRFRETGRGHVGTKGRVGGAGQTLNTGRFDREQRPIVSADEATQKDLVRSGEARKMVFEYEVVSRGVDTQLRPIVHIRIPGAPRAISSKPDPRHGPVLTVRAPDKPLPPPKGEIPGDAGNELIISTAHARENWHLLGQNARKDFRRKGLEPIPEHDLLTQAVREWWKNLGTQ